MMDFQNIGVLINEFNCTGFRVEVDSYINLMTRIYLIYFTPGTLFDSLIVPLFQIEPTKSSSKENVYVLLSGFSWLHLLLLIKVFFHLPNRMDNYSGKI